MSLLSGADARIPGQQCRIDAPFFQLLQLSTDERFHVRELERLTGISAGSLHRELKAMAEAGLLVREQQGNQVLYRADRSCSIYEELASIFRKTVGLAAQLTTALQPLADRIKVAFVFGSMASLLPQARVPDSC